MTELYKDYPHTDTWTKCKGDHVYVDCPECKSNIRLDAHRCPHCHTDLEPRFSIWREAYPILIRREQRRARIKSVLVIAGIVLLIYAIPYLHIIVKMI